MDVPPLESLPDEILGQIFGYFCTHCSREVDTWFDGQSTPSAFFIYGYRPDRNRPAIQTLRNLCLVSRRVGNVAQEYLYHAPPIKNDESLHSYKLHKTFRNRPDLTSHIRLLPLMPRAAAMENILANSRNLEVMLIQPGSKIFNTAYWEVAAREGGYPKLGTAVFEYGLYGFDRVRYDKLLLSLSESAPCLRVLDLHFTRNIVPPPEGFKLPIVKLVLRGIDGPRHLSTAKFDELVRAFPNMTDFTFAWQSAFSTRNKTIPVDATPFGHILTKGLDGHRKQLKRLTLVSPCLRSEKSIPVKELPEFKDFSALEVFISDNCTVGLTGGLNVACRAPPSQIKELWIYQHELASENEMLEESVLKLAFPDLRRVGIGGQRDCFGKSMNHVDKKALGEGIDVFQLPDWDMRM